ncbi:MAG TPA: cysteine hydrolase family protein, partial [Bacillota bacterium]|nr:cysteine hydrolase family protein [Bacillota bacterium]
KNPAPDWKKTALLIIDIQNDYFPGGKFELLNSEAASLKAKDLLNAFRKKKITVIHIRHENVGPKAFFFLPGTPGAEIHTSVAPQTGEPVILKNAANSFTNTNLADELQKSSITNLIICGMQTNLCVQKTSLEALQRGFTVTVVDDAVAAKTLELHQTALQEMEKAKTIFTKTDTLIRSL